MVEVAFFALLLVGIYFFMLYMPTSVLLNDGKKKDDKNESLLIFIAFSLLIVLLTFLFANYYLLNAERGSIMCDSIANLSCIIHDRVNKTITPTVGVSLMLFVQLAISYAYVYFATKQVNHFKNASRRVTAITVFYITSIVLSLLHLIVLYEVAFTSGIKYVGLFIANAYVLMPLVYLILLAYFNKEKLEQQKRI